MTFKNFNQINDLEFVDFAKELIDYQATTVKDDKYYKRISKDDILEIVSRNKAIVNGIKNKCYLNIEGYTEVLNGVGFMIRDYLVKKFDVYCKRISDSCIGYELVSENNLPLINVAMGSYQDKWHWYLQSQKGKVLLVKFKRNKNHKNIKYRGKGADIDVTDCKCFQVGKAKIIISDSDKKIYCLSTENEYIFVVKNPENEYKCYGRYDRSA